MSPIQVLDENLESPLPSECLLDPARRYMPLSQVGHKFLTLAFRAETLLDARDDILELMDMVHQLLLPSCDLDPLE